MVLFPVDARFSLFFQKAPRPLNFLFNGHRVSVPTVRRPEHEVTYAFPSSAEVKEIVELYLYSPSGFSWSFLGPSLTLQHFHKLGRVSNLCKQNVADANRTRMTNTCWVYTML